MEFNEYQLKAARTINKDLTHREMRNHALYEIAAEVGEIHSIFQKSYQGHSVNLDNLKKEIGDVLWGLAELCTSYGWALEDIAALNIEKLKARYPDGFSEECSLHREE